jgi:hypothetical protein
MVPAVEAPVAPVPLLPAPKAPANIALPAAQAFEKVVGPAARSLIPRSIITYDEGPSPTSAAFEELAATPLPTLDEAIVQAQEAMDNALGTWDYLTPEAVGSQKIEHQKGTSTISELIDIALDRRKRRKQLEADRAERMKAFEEEPRVTTTIVPGRPGDEPIWDVLRRFNWRTFQPEPVRSWDVGVGERYHPSALAASLRSAGF